MADNKSRDKLLEFLDYLADKGLMARATANARRAAANKVLGILSEEEANDVTILDLDEVMSRFQNLEGKSYTPRSLTTYHGRIKAAVDDFDRYVKNPLGFKPNVRSRERRRSESPKPERVQRSEEDKGHVETRTAPPPMSNSIVPIPIRQDTTVFVQGLPFDLSEAEAERIANVIRAMATPV